MKTILRLLKHSFRTGKIPAAKYLAVGFIIILLSLSVATQASATLFYTGDIYIDSLSATIDVTNEATIIVEYTLVNQGDNKETVNLTFSHPDAAAFVDKDESSNPVDFNPGEKRKLTFSYSLSLPSAEFQRIMFAPMLFFNDMPNSQRTKSYNIRLILPEGVKKLVYSNKPYTNIVTEGIRVAILWKKSDVYPTTLVAAWTTLDVDIAAVKKATPSKLTAPGEIVEVEITIQNKGGKEIRDITLSDNFFPNAFEAVAPMDEFELVQPEMSDSHLYWKKKIEGLKPGETKSYTYSIKVKALGTETRLDSLVVLVNGIPVSVSNDVILYSELEERYKPEAPERKFPTKFVIIGVVVVAVIIASVLVIKSRRKKGKV
jgi:hypothetical protein